MITDYRNRFWVLFFFLLLTVDHAEINDSSAAENRRAGSIKVSFILRTIIIICRHITSHNISYVKYCDWHGVTYYFASGAIEFFRATNP